MMTQVRKQRSPAKSRSPISPKQAVRCCGPIAELLEPELFKALCDPTRAELLACLIRCGRPCGVGEIAECCDVDLSVVSRHLRTLERAGILDSVKKGRAVTYAVRSDHLCDTLRRLADVIEQFAPSSCQANCCKPNCNPHN